MNKIKLACLASLLVSGIASAGPACEGFQLKIKNNTADSLLFTHVGLHGAQIQPGSFQKLNKGAEQVFTVNGSADNVPMNGEFVFNTVSMPTKHVKIQYTLTNVGLVCKHDDTTTDGQQLSVEKSRSVNQATYAVSP